MLISAGQMLVTQRSARNNDIGCFLRKHLS